MDNSSGLWFGICSLAVWRLTHLLHAEDGPWDLIARLRRALGGGMTGRLVACFYCLSLWVAAPFAVLLARNWAEGICLWLGLSAAAILLLRFTEARTHPAPHWREGDNEGEQL